MKTTPLRILHVEKSMHAGGIERHVVNVAIHTAALGHHVRVACVKGSWLEKQLSAAGIPLCQLPIPLVRPLRRKVAANAIRRIVRETSVDVIHSHDFHGAIYSLLAAQLEGVPNVRTMHGFNLDAGSLAADYLICVSEAVRNEYLRRGMTLPAHTDVIYPGVDTALFRPLGPEVRRRVRSALGIPQDARVAGMVSRLTPAKGTTDLLQALASLPSVYGTFFGRAKPSYMKHLKKCVKDFGLSGRVVFAGLADDVPAAYSALDVLVAPSHQEGFGLTIAEASACAVPLIAANVGGIPEIITDGVNGLLTPPQDTQSLAHAIARTLDSTSTAMAREARRIAVDRFDLGITIRKLEQVYQSCRAHKSRLS